MKIGKSIVEFNFIPSVAHRVSFIDLYSRDVKGYVMEKLWYGIDDVEHPYLMAIFNL